MSNWIKNRLTKTKQESPLWADLADSIQSVIGTHVETYLDRLKRRVSLFDADKEDLQVILTELGDFFALGDVEDDDIALTVMQRQDEIHQKRTIYPLTNTINREFGGMNVTWEPLYAPIDQVKYPYGSRLVIESELEQELIPRDEWFLTSRGAIRVPLNEVHRVFNATDAGMGEFEDRLRRVIYPLIPLRVVCEGQQYYLYYDLAERIERLNIVQSNIEQYPIATSEADEVADINNSVVSSAFDLGLPVGEIVKNTELLIDEIPIDSFASDFQLE